MATYVESVEDFTVRRVLQQQFLESQDTQKEFFRSRGEVVGLTMLHVGEVIISNDLLQDLVESIERVDPMLQIRTRPSPTCFDNGVQQTREFILSDSLNSINHVGDTRIRRTTPLRCAFEPHLG